jgi:hypothetical protein
MNLAHYQPGSAAMLCPAAQEKGHSLLAVAGEKMRTKLRMVFPGKRQ